MDKNLPVFYAYDICYMWEGFWIAILSGRLVPFGLALDPAPDLVLDLALDLAVPQ
jgi:hypothetical protein